MSGVTPQRDPWEELFEGDPAQGFRPDFAWDRVLRSLTVIYDQGGLLFTSLRDQRTVFQYSGPGLDPDDAGYSLEAGPDGGPSPGMLELALNAYVPPGADGEEVVECRRNVASRTAWELHEAFAREKLLPLAPEGGEIPYREIMDWIESERPGTESALFGVRDG